MGSFLNLFVTIVENFDDFQVKSLPMRKLINRVDKRFNFFVAVDVLTNLGKFR